MNIEFTIKASTFKKAADIEQFLKAQGITYEYKVDAKPSLGAAREGRHARIGKDELAAVMLCIDTHPKWSWKEVSQSTGVGSSTVGRIKNGTHPLQGKKANPYMPAAAVDTL